MTGRQRLRDGAILLHSAFGLAAIITALAAPVMAQMPAGIPGVVAPGIVPELVQEGFVFTEGPVSTADGGLYFSDIRTNRTYFLDPGGKISVARENTSGANGLALKKDGELLFAEGDGKTLIVDDTLNATVFAYDVQPDGSVKNKRPFLQLRDIPPGAESGADGLAVDRDGRFYITTLTGVQVFEAKGEYLGTIKTSRQPANVAFGGPGKQTLYITAREGLYRVKTLARGPDRLGK